MKTDELFTPRVTLVVTWADGSVERKTGSIQAVAEIMAKYTSRPAPPEMRVEIPKEATGTCKVHPAPHREHEYAGAEGSELCEDWTPAAKEP